METNDFSVLTDQVKKLVVTVEQLTVKVEQHLRKSTEEVNYKAQVTKNTKRAFIKEKKQKLDFSINEKAFINRYASGKSGSKKFVLLLAFLVKGEVGKSIPIAEIKRKWNKMSGKKMLGEFNRFHPNSAMIQGWVDSKEYGTYCLTDNWKERLPYE